MYYAKMPDKSWILCIILYRFFCQHSSLYTSYVCSQLEYACPVWDPYQTTAVAALEKVKKFALRLCSKNWLYNCDYSSLLRQCNLPTLESRRLYLYQIINRNYTFSNAPLIRCTLPPGLRNTGSTQFKRPICSIDAHLFSFFPHIISKWNTLPCEVQSRDTLSSFKYYLLC